MGPFYGWWVCPLRWVCRVGYENWSWLTLTRALNNCFTWGAPQRYDSTNLFQTNIIRQADKKSEAKFSVHMAGTIHVYTAEPTPTPMKQNMFLQFPFEQNIGLSPSKQQKRDVWKIFHPCRKKHRFSHLGDLDFWSLNTVLLANVRIHILMISTRNRFSNPSHILPCFGALPAFPYDFFML